MNQEKLELAHDQLIFITSKLQKQVDTLSSELKPLKQAFKFEKAARTKTYWNEKKKINCFDYITLTMGDYKFALELKAKAKCELSFWECENWFIQIILKCIEYENDDKTSQKIDHVLDWISFRENVDNLSLVFDDDGKFAFSTSTYQARIKRTIEILSLLKIKTLKNSIFISDLEMINFKLDLLNTWLMTCSEIETRLSNLLQHFVETSNEKMMQQVQSHINLVKTWI